MLMVVLDTIINVYFMINTLHKYKKMHWKKKWYEFHILIIYSKNYCNYLVTFRNQTENEWSTKIHISFRSVFIIPFDYVSLLECTYYIGNSILQFSCPYSI